MLSLLFPKGSFDDDLLTAELYERGTSGTVEEADGLRAYFEDEAAASGLAEQYGISLRREPEITQIAVAPAPEPVLLSERFAIVESPESDVPHGRQRLVVRSSNAFGTGRHETTQLCTQALERHVRHGNRLLDVGCGSGILSLIADVLGARVFSCDLHPNAIAASSENLQTPLFWGTIGAVRTHSMDVAVANISPGVISTLGADLQRIVKPGGLLILSGFLAERVPEGFEPAEVSERDGWLCWVCGVGEGAGGERDLNWLTRSHAEEWW